MAKNITEWLARSIIVRNHCRDEELRALRARAKEFQCHECKLQFSRGEILNRDTAKCAICRYIFCIDCLGDNDHGHVRQCIINHTPIKRR
jgi:hypothetical protein